jgi:ribonuclease P protein component
VRNRIKRIVRERFRISKEALAGLDIVVVALQPAGSAGNEELVASIDRHWQALVEKVKKSGT